ncbi:G2/mitotic-specific cyclin [Kappamyces sp. JEL0680]|nr:G2/mitotic-specific cyclin [Kappamyces sp. JEL0680]
MQRVSAQNTLLPSSRNNRQPLGTLSSQTVKSSAVKQPTSRYAQGVYKPLPPPSAGAGNNESAAKLNRKHSLSEVRPQQGHVQDEDQGRSKRVKTSTVSKPVLPASTNAVTAAKLSLKEKQLLKERRTRRTGIVPALKPASTAASLVALSASVQQLKSSTSSVLSEQLSRFSSSITSRRDSCYSQSHDGTSRMTDVSMQLEHDPASRTLPSAAHAVKTIHVARASQLQRNAKADSAKERPPVPATVAKKRTVLAKPASEKRLVQVETFSLPGNLLKKSPFVSLEKAQSSVRGRRNKRLALSQDPIQALEYEHDIYVYWREIEISTLPDPHYMFKQPELDWGMRSTLVAWIIQVHAQFKLLPETLYLAINLIDRTLSLKSISLSKLQLVGVTALLIASKYEEILCPSVHDLVYMTDNGYSDEEIRRAERHMLSIVEYQIGYPNPLNYLRRVARNAPDVRVEALAHYFLEVMLLGQEFLQYPSSHLAAAAYFLSIKAIHNADWVRCRLLTQSPLHVSLLGYTETALLQCVYALLEYLKHHQQYEMVYAKYGTAHFYNVSIGMRHFLAAKAI